MKITEASHTDHALSPDHLAFILSKLGAAEGFAVVTLDIPENLPAVPCTLHGPLVGGAPISEDEVIYKVRGSRKGTSRLVNRPPSPSRKITVIHGEHEGETILFTAYGGPCAPREAWEPTLTDEERMESNLFWAQHALSEVA